MILSIFAGVFIRHIFVVVGFSLFFSVHFSLRGIVRYMWAIFIFSSSSGISASASRHSLRWSANFQFPVKV